MSLQFLHFDATRAPWPSPAPPSARSPSPARGGRSAASLSPAQTTAPPGPRPPPPPSPPSRAPAAPPSRPTMPCPATIQRHPRRLCPPYHLSHDRTRGEVVLAVRGLDLARLEDYRVLLDAGGPEPFAGGHAHRGLLRAAVWLLDREGPALRRMVAEAGPAGCRLVFLGHSLGAGVAALAAVVAVRCWLGRLGLRRGDVTCYAMAPPRCMSLGLAVEYADVVHSVVLQDDFLPRTPAPLQHIFASVFCLPCLLCFICMRDTFVSEGKLMDPTKLYAPGRVFHIVERRNCRCGRFPPQVRTAVPAEGRFEHVVLSCNATADHGIIWIEKEAQKALDLMGQEGEELTSPPSQQKMLRAQETKSLAEHRLNTMEHLLFIQEETSTTSRSTSSSTTSEWGELVEIFLHDHDEDSDPRHDDGRNMCSSIMDYLPSCCK